MKLSVIKKYLKIWAYYFKFSLISATTYRASFFIELIVEMGYLLWLFFFIQVVYSNVKEVAGWNHMEMLFLIGLYIVSVEIYIGLFYVFGFRIIPEKIKDGKIDFVLLKPINSLFNLTTGMPYITSFVATVPGIYLMYYASQGLSIAWSAWHIVMAIFLLACGLVIAYSISVILTSFSFVFLNAIFLPEIANKTTDFGQNPHQVYNFIGLKVLFFILLPVVFMASLPASAVIKTLNPVYLLMGACLAFLFFVMAIKIWNCLIKKYTSASS